MNYYNNWNPPLAETIVYRMNHPIYKHLPDNYTNGIDSDEVTETIIKLENLEYACHDCIHYVLGNCILKTGKTSKEAICQAFEPNPPPPEQVYDMRIIKGEYETEIFPLDDHEGFYYPKNSKIKIPAQIFDFIGLDYYTILRIFFESPINIPYGREITLEELSEDILYIQRRHYGQLSHKAKSILKNNIIDLVKLKEDKFKIFNTARSITSKLHQLKLLPGLTPQVRYQIVEERKERSFTDLKDVKERVDINPYYIIASRILKEQLNDIRYFLFRKPPF